MTSIIQQRITSFYLFIFIIFFSINQPVFSNQFVDLLHLIRNKNTDNNQSNDNLGIISIFLFLFINNSFI